MSRLGNGGGGSGAKSDRGQSGGLDGKERLGGKPNDLERIFAESEFGRAKLEKLSRFQGVARPISKHTRVLTRNSEKLPGTVSCKKGNGERR